MDLSMRERTISLRLFKQNQLPKKIRPYVLQVLAELLDEGFSLKQSLQFLQVILPKYAALFDGMIAHLEAGQPFEKCLHPVGYSLSVVSQLFYAQRQGRFDASLHQMSRHLEEKRTYEQKFLRLMIYPLLLGLFLIVMLFGMRAFILPHVLSFVSEGVFQENMWVRILIMGFTFLPQMMIGFTALVAIIYAILDRYLLKQPPLEQYRFISRFPLVSRWSRWYLTYRVSHEMAHFLMGGYSLQQMVQLWVDYPIDPLLTTLAEVIQQQMRQGHELCEVIDNLALFTSEFTLIIQQGEMTSQVGAKCRVYSTKIFRDLMRDIEQKMAFIQPILFIIIAILVMSMYLVLMLPMLTMEGL